MERRNRIFYGAALLAAVGFAVGVSQFASDAPDGLEYVAEQEGFLDTAEDHTLGDAPLAGYGEGLSDNSALNTAVAGLLGVLVTLALGYGIFWLVRRRAPNGTDQPTGPR